MITAKAQEFGIGPATVLRHCQSNSDVVFVTGSRIIGLGNRHSDYDLYVIRDDARDDGVPLVDFGVDNYVDFEVWTFGRLEQVASTVNAAALDDSNATLSIREADLDLYFRTAIGVCLFNAPRFAALQEPFDIEQAQQVIAARHRYAASLVAREAKALRRLGLDATARSRVRRAGGHVVDAALAAAGDAYPNPKFRHEKLARTPLGGAARYDAFQRSASREGFEEAWEMLGTLAGDLGVGLPEIVPVPGSICPAPRLTLHGLGRTRIVALGTKAYVLDQVAASVVEAVLAGDAGVSSEGCDSDPDLTDSTPRSLDDVLFAGRAYGLWDFALAATTRELVRGDLPMGPVGDVTFERAPGTARDVAAGLVLTVSAAPHLSAIAHDIAGARDAAQWGLLVHAARALLNVCLFLRLAQFGIVPDATDDLVIALRNAERRPLMADRAQRLLETTPRGFDEADTFATECERFAVELGFDIPEVGRAGIIDQYIDNGPVARGLADLYELGDVRVPDVVDWHRNS